MDNSGEKHTRYQQAEALDGPVVLPLPQATQDLHQAQEDLRTHGCCIVNNVLDDNAISDLKARMDRQFAAELALGEQCPDRGSSNKIVIPNLVNKMFFIRLENENNPSIKISVQ